MSSLAAVFGLPGKFLLSLGTGKGGNATGTINSDYNNYYGLGGGGGAYGYESIEVTPGTYYTVATGPSGTGLKQNDEYLIFAKLEVMGNNANMCPVGRKIRFVFYTWRIFNCRI